MLYGTMNDSAVLTIAKKAGRVRKTRNARREWAQEAGVLAAALVGAVWAFRSVRTLVVAAVLLGAVVLLFDVWSAVFVYLMVATVYSMTYVLRNL